MSTAHIHWDPKYSDVKLIQTMMLMHELKCFIDTVLQKCNIPPYQKVEPNVIPLLLCGDFNSLPNSGNLLFILLFLFKFVIRVIFTTVLKLSFKSLLRSL